MDITTIIAIAALGISIFSSFFSWYKYHKFEKNIGSLQIEKLNKELKSYEKAILYVRQVKSNIPTKYQIEVKNVGKCIAKNVSVVYCSNCVAHSLINDLNKEIFPDQAISLYLMVTDLEGKIELRWDDDSQKNNISVHPITLK